MPETRRFHSTQRGDPVGRPTAAPMAIVYRAIDTLKPDPSNPRRHSKKQVQQITDSIRIFGFNVPILIDREGRVIAGHGRLLAASELGMTEVPTLCLEHLSHGQARAFMIADNRLTEIATWDDRLLAEQLKELSLQGLDFSLEITGFEMGEIDLRIDSLDKTPESDDPVDAHPRFRSGRRSAGPAICG
jgi:ParB-like chromosome segregation protein Spo0J